MFLFIDCYNLAIVNIAKLYFFVTIQPGLKSDFSSKAFKMWGVTQLFERLRIIDLNHYDVDQVGSKIRLNGFGRARSRPRSIEACPKSNSKHNQIVNHLY